MTFATLIRRSVRFHARAHFGVVLGAAIGSAALIGALLVGDSVRESLREHALNRLGAIHFAVSGGDRLFRTTLAERLRNDQLSQSQGVSPSAASSVLAPGLAVRGVAAKQDGSGRANQVNVIGAATEYWPALARWGGLGGKRSHLDEAQTTPATRSPLEAWKAGQTVLINETLARQLSAAPGDEIVVRVQKPTALALDAAISPKSDNAVAMRLKIGSILAPEQTGDFALSVGPLPPANLFVPLETLASALGVEGRANLLVSGPLVGKSRTTWWRERRESWARSLRFLGLRQRAASRPRVQPNGSLLYSDPQSLPWPERLARSIEPGREEYVPDELAVPLLNLRMQHAWRLEDAELVVRAIEQPQTETEGEYIRPFVEVSSSRIFLEPQIVTAGFTAGSRSPATDGALESDPGKHLRLTIVSNAVGVLTYLANLISSGDHAAPYSMVGALGDKFLPPNMRDDEIVLNEWLADDLGVKPGDVVKVGYYAVDSGSTLIERTNSFRVKLVVPIKGIYGDRTLMPEFPGIAKAERTQDWDTGFPLTYKIREKDEAYWKRYRGTPKAFVTLRAGQAMWANRFGSLTAIRYEVPTNSFADPCREAVYRNLLGNLDPGKLGLGFEAVRDQALKGADQSQDFGQLFIGFSIFLVAAALLLTTLLFQFGVEQRVTEIGTLLALGFKPKQVRRLFLLEGVALAVAGGIAGALGGLGYAKSMVWALTTLWRSAVGNSALRFHAGATSLIAGAFAGILVAVLAIWVTLRKQAKQPARELLAGEGSRVNAPKAILRSRGAWIAIGSSLAAAGIITWTIATGDRANAEAFFSAGALLLIAGLGAVAAWLGALGVNAQAAGFTLATLGVRGCARRRKRSLATIALLACGSFVIASIGVFRLDANLEANSRSSGTGGFALIGESTLPVLQDLNSRPGREFFGLDDRDLAEVNIVSFRLRAGDEASCLNLNRAQKPRLLGAKPESLAGRFMFADAAKGCDRSKGWELLKSTPLPADEVPAIGDANSIQWALGKKLGDTIDYTDAAGRPFKIRLVAAVANSILQGSLLIDETEFVKRFPNESGYRMFLIDTPTNSVATIAATLSRALQDAGLEVTPTTQRLNAFNAVQNTYLGTFQILGGLGLLLGSAGLGVVVLRNVLERRGELALLIAVGFRRHALNRLILGEHGALLGAGLSLGIVCAAVAVLPALLSPGTNLPYGSLALTLGAVLLNGGLWAWLATRYALRGNLLAALRNE